MNPSFKKVSILFAIVLFISLGIITMSQVCFAIPCGTCRLMSYETIFDEVDPNEPEDLPEMVPNSIFVNVINEDSNDLPDPLPEMVPFI